MRCHALISPLVLLAGAGAGHAHTLSVARHMRTRAGAHSFGIQNAAVTYTTVIGVGSPPTNYTLLIDTGSSNTWFKSDTGLFGLADPTRCVKVDKKVTHSGLMAVAYGSGNVIGVERNETVTLSPNLVVRSQGIGCGIVASGFPDGIDGILGVGPSSLTRGTTTGALAGGTQTVPTVTDNLYAQGTIAEPVLGVFFAPSAPDSGTGAGELTFGGADASKMTGAAAYVNLTHADPAGEYWGVDATFAYGGATIVRAGSGIVDTGTTLVLLSSDAFAAYSKATGGVPDSATGLLRITGAQYAALKPLDVVVGGNIYALTPNAQIWPRALNADIGGEAGAIYLIVGDMGATESGIDFVLGYTFLQRFYSVYDTERGRVGFAQTEFTGAETN